MKELILVLILIILLTGVPYTICYFGNLAKARPEVNITVGIALFLGFYGLESIYVSTRYTEQKRRIRVLFCGACCVLTAFCVLEVLLRQMGRM